MPVRNSKRIQVCATCLRASCWYGEFFCDEAMTSTTTVKTAGALRDLRLEDESNWTDPKFLEVYGTTKPDFPTALEE